MKMRRKLKLIIFYFVFLALINSAFADEIEINLIEYHPDSYYTRLQVRNNAGKDLNDLTIKIGDGFETSSQGVFKNGANYNAILNIPPGEHQVTVTTKEGVSSSKLVYFSLSKQEVKKEVSRAQEAVREKEELRKTAEQNLELAQGQIDVERGKAIELGILKEDRDSINIILIGTIIAFIIGIIVVYWFIRGSNRGNKE